MEQKGLSEESLSFWAYQINSDAFYFGELESENILVHVDPAVIKAMASFVFIAILKDILVGAYMHMLYEGIGIIKNVKHLSVILFDSILL